MPSPTPSRRAFLASSLAATAALPALAAARRPDRVADTGPYIDMHTHVGRTWTADPPMTPELLVRWMDEHNVSKAIVLPLVSPESSSYLNLSEQALDAGKKFPDRLVPFCCIDPRTSYTKGKAGLKGMIQEWVDQGAKGFGEHKAGIAIDHPLNMTLYEVLGELGLPVLFHCDNLRGLDKAGLPGLENALASHPDVNFIGHGPGFWASISGDLTDEGLGSYPKGPVAPGGALDRLLAKHKNLWCDLSAGSGSNAISRDLAFGREFLIRNSERVMFGTDYLKEGQVVPQFELFQTIELPDDVRARIERENAAKLLKLDA